MTEFIYSQRYIFSIVLVEHPNFPATVGFGTPWPLNETKHALFCGLTQLQHNFFTSSRVGPSKVYSELFFTTHTVPESFSNQIERFGCSEFCGFNRLILAQGEVFTTSGGSVPIFKHSTRAARTAVSGSYKAPTPKCFSTFRFF